MNVRIKKLRKEISQAIEKYGEDMNVPDELKMLLVRCYAKLAMKESS